MRKFLLYILVLSGLLCSVIIYPAKAQYKLTLTYKIDTPAVFITTDNLDNVYVVTQKNQLLKYNASGKLLWNYSNKAFGKLGHVNATDPMRILLYYPAIQQAVVLNNNLNEINRFNFGDNSSKLISVIATANSNGYWIYDQASQTLQRLGNQFQDELSSGNIYQITHLAVQPSIIQASDQYVYLLDPQVGILQFDRFGNYITIVKANSDNFQVKNNAIYTLNNRSWDCFKVSTAVKTKLFTFDETIKQASEGSKLLAVLTNDAVKVYSILEINESN